MTAPGFDSPVSRIEALYETALSRSAFGLRRVVLAAVVVGVAVGAMACAAGMAAGGGHRAHIAAAEADRSPSEDSHAGHSSQAPDAEIGAAPERPAAQGNNGTDRSTASQLQSHPGMACVVSVDLRLLEPTLTSVSDIVDVPAAAKRSNCVADLEPPVPRIS